MSNSTLNSGNETLAARAMKIIEECERSQQSITLEDLARRLKVRRSTLSSALKEAGILTAGLRTRAGRIPGRVERLPIFELVGIHAQGAFVSDSPECGAQRDLLVAMAFAMRGFPNYPQSKRKRQPLEDMLAPSFVSSDKLRITKFETLFPILLDRLSASSEAIFSSEEALAAIRGFQELESNGYRVGVFLYAEGKALQMISDIIGMCAGIDCSRLNSSLDHLLASFASNPSVACLGPGFFPMMGTTVKRIEATIDNPEPCRSFSLSWTASEIEAVVMHRMLVCDGLTQEGLLYGAPVTKHGEMANRTQTAFTRELLVRDYIYGDGLHQTGRELSKPMVGLAMPARVRPKLLQEFQVDYRGCADFIKIMRLNCEGKDVECLVAWLPNLRRVLLQSLRGPKLQKLHARWLDSQERTLKRIADTPHRECLEIINPEGMMTMGELANSPAMRHGATFAQNLILGMVLTAYDADLFLGHLIGERSRKKWSQLQSQWLKLIVSELEREANRERMIFLSRWSHRGSAEEALNSSLCNVKKHGARLIRYILEQAAVKFSKIALKTAQQLGVGPGYWPNEEHAEEKSIEILLKEGTDIWPVVGIRMDYLLKHMGGQVRKRAKDEWKHRKRSDEAEDKYLLADDEGSRWDNDHFDPFRDDGDDEDPYDSALW